MRTEAKLKQADVAMRLNRPQSFVAKYETGERRIDVVEFIEIAEAVGFDPVTFLADFLSDGSTDDSGARQPRAGPARPASRLPARSRVTVDTQGRERHDGRGPIRPSDGQARRRRGGRGVGPTVGCVG